MSDGQFLPVLVIEGERKFGIRSALRPPITVRPSLLSLDRIVRELIPYFGTQCQVSVLYGAESQDPTIVRGTLLTIVDMLRARGDLENPVPTVMVG